MSISTAPSAPRPWSSCAAARRVELPTRDLEALRRYMLVDDAANLEDYLRRFDVTIALLQTPEAIERVAYEMVRGRRRATACACSRSATAPS